MASGCSVPEPLHALRVVYLSNSGTKSRNVNISDRLLFRYVYRYAVAKYRYFIKM